MRSPITAVALAAALASAALVSAARADDPPSGGDTGTPATVKISLHLGTGDDRRSVKGILFSPNPACVDGQRITFYRQTRDDEGNVVSERRAGYVIAEGLTDTPTRSKVFRFGLVRGGLIVAKTDATDDCLAGKSKAVRYRRRF